MAAQTQRNQPQGQVRIDAGNPLARGLVDAWVGSNPLSQLSAGKAQQLAQTGVVPRVVDTTGRGLLFDGSSQYLSKTVSAITSAAEATILVIAAPANTANTTRAIFGYGNTATANSLMFIGQGGTTGQLSFWARSDGNVSQNLQVVPASGWVAGVPAVLVGTRSESQGFHRLYLNGVSLSPLASTALGATTFNRTAIGGLLRSSFGLGFNGTVYLTLSWDRALSDAEVQQISANPWQLFQSSSQRQLITGAAAPLAQKRAVILRSGVLAEIADAEIGSGVKPVVLHNGRLRQRAASEGDPVVLENGRLRRLAEGEMLLL